MMLIKHKILRPWDVNRQETSGEERNSDVYEEEREREREKEIVGTSVGGYPGWLVRQLHWGTWAGSQPTSLPTVMSQAVHL